MKWLLFFFAFFALFVSAKAVTSAKVVKQYDVSVHPPPLVIQNDISIIGLPQVGCMVKKSTANKQAKQIKFYNGIKPKSLEYSRSIGYPLKFEFYRVGNERKYFNSVSNKSKDKAIINRNCRYGLSKS